MIAELRMLLQVFESREIMVSSKEYSLKFDLSIKEARSGIVILSLDVGTCCIFLVMFWVSLQ